MINKSIFILITILLLSSIPTSFGEMVDHDNQWMQGLSAVFMIPNNPIDATGSMWESYHDIDFLWETHTILDARNGFCQIKKDGKLLWINSAFIWSINNNPE